MSLLPAESPMVLRVSIRDESRRNLRILSPSSDLSAQRIMSTDSLKPLAISILCPAIHCPMRIFDSLSASACLTNLILSASHSLIAASLSLSDATTLFMAFITEFSSLISFT